MTMPAQCTECARPLRRSTDRKPAPGTVTHSGNGLCTTCSTSKRRGTVPVPAQCSDCGARLRSKRARPELNPGTVVHVARGFCRTCYDANRHLATGEMYPEVSAERHAHTMAGYTAWLTEGRKRGVPADGYQVEDEPDTVAQLLSARGKTPSQRRSIARLVEQLEAERAGVAAATARQERRHRAEYGIVA